MCLVTAQVAETYIWDMAVSSSTAVEDGDAIMCGVENVGCIGLG